MQVVMDRPQFGGVISLLVIVNHRSVFATGLENEDPTDVGGLVVHGAAEGASSACRPPPPRPSASDGCSSARISVSRDPGPVTQFIMSGLRRFMSGGITLNETVRIVKVAPLMTQYILAQLAEMQHA